jgi:hypothetical protein
MPGQSIFVSKVLRSYGPQVDCTAPLNGSLLHLPQVMAWTRESAKQLMFSTSRYRKASWEGAANSTGGGQQPAERCG